MVPITASGGVNDKVTYVLSQIAVTYDGSELVSGMLNVTNMSFGITASPATRYPTPTQSPSLAPTAAKDYNSLTPSLVPTYVQLAGWLAGRPTIVSSRRVLKTLVWPPSSTTTMQRS